MTRKNLNKIVEDFYINIGILKYIPGFRSKSLPHIALALCYYFMSGVLSIATDSFPFMTVLLLGLPFVVFAVLDIVRQKKYINAIALPIYILLLIVSALLTNITVIPTGIQLSAKEIVFDDINQIQNIEYTVTPENADVTNIEMVSENSDIAYFENNALISKTEGETTVYAELSTDNTVISEKIHVTVHDKTAEAEREANRKAEEARAKQEAEEKARQEAEKAQQAQQAQQAQHAQSSTSNNQSENTQSKETVYIGKTGNKYHKKSCPTLKGNGTAISIDEAKAQGREACKTCY